MGDPRLTTQTLTLLAVMVQEADRPRYGLELSAAAGIKSGIIYPTLARLERAGWLDSEWEEIDPSEAGRPRRRLYHLTETGKERGRDALVARTSRLQLALHAPQRARTA